MQIPQQALPVAQKLTGTITSFKLPGGLIFAPSYFQAGLIVILLFLLVLTMGQLRRHIADWQLRGVVPGVYIGFALAVIVEGLLLVSGRTILTEVLGWKNAPKPLVNALDAGRSKMVDVLGASEEIPTSNASDLPTVGKIMNEYDNLTPDDQKALEQLICQ
jgi:hypothetical protein